jgi:hypothetical protein
MLMYEIRCRRDVEATPCAWSTKALPPREETEAFLQGRLRHLLEVAAARGRPVPSPEDALLQRALRGDRATRAERRVWSQWGYQCPWCSTYTQLWQGVCRAVLIRDVSRMRGSSNRLLDRLPRV